MKPSIGRIVHYTLSDFDAQRVNEVHRRRGVSPEEPTGNSVQAGDVYPLIITRVWGDTEQSAVNGQVLLDGNAALWVTSVSQVDDEHPIGTGSRWYEPPRV